VAASALSYSSRPSIAIQLEERFMNPQSAIQRRSRRLDSEAELLAKQKATAAAERIRSKAVPEEKHIQHSPDKLPDPWLFNSESLLRELDRCRELILEIPVSTHATHFAVNIAIDGLWNLRENLRYLLSLHREGQRSFARKTEPEAKSRRKAAGKDQKIVGIGA
jgi:hypothetical protein